MTKILKWKLSEKPSAENLLKFVEGGVITKEEAKKIVLEDTEITQSQFDELKSEVELLKKIVLKLTEETRSTGVVKIIEREIPIYIHQYYPQPYTQRYWWSDVVLCASNTAQLAGQSSAPQITSIANNLIQSTN